MGLSYLDLLELHRITPNFWCSGEYFEKAALTEEEIGAEGYKLVCVRDEDWHVLPLISPQIGLVPFAPKDKPTWSDFEKSSYLNAEPSLLDLEYIYDPLAFQDMSGHKWMTFRKNCRKWPRNNPNCNYWKYEWKELKDVLQTWMEWLEGLDDEEEVQDAEVIEKYMMTGKNRMVLWRGNEIVGVNIWDENYMFVNYRYCFCKPEPFLSEYMRWLFYTDPVIMGKGKLVNDGGVLGKESLERFKDKMNPLRVRRVHSWHVPSYWKVYKEIPNGSRSEGIAGSPAQGAPGAGDGTTGGAV